MTANFSYGELKIFSGRAHPALAQEICDYLEIPLGELTLYNFSDGENYCQIDENVRGADVFVVQPTCSPVNDHVMELLILLDAFRRSSASRITAVMPYFGYGRQDKKDKPRVPIAAKLMADLLTASGADRILTMDLHAAQIQGFFNIPVDHLFAAPVLLDAIRKLDLEDLVIVSPDVGGVARARAIGEAARRFAGHHRQAADREERNGGPERRRRRRGTQRADPGRHHRHGRHARPGGGGAAAARGRGRPSPPPCIPSCPDRPSSASRPRRLETLLVTNTIPLDAALARCPRIRSLSIAPLLGEAIQRIHEGTSVSSLFV